MLMRKGEHWTCMNPFCGGSVTLHLSYYSREDPPRCPCGSPLRIAPRPASFNYLQFLRPDPSGCVGEPKKNK
jgi:hypothetical protein